MKKDKELWREAFYHCHGRPQRETRVYDIDHKGVMAFHLIPELNVFAPHGEIGHFSLRKSKNLINARTLMLQTAHFLGLKAGDSLSWQEVNDYTGRPEVHQLCFDGSGLDMTHKQDLPKLVEMRIETGLQGIELLNLFAYKYAVDCFLILWRGNKKLIEPIARVIKGTDFTKIEQLIQAF